MRLIFKNLIINKEEILLIVKRFIKVDMPLGAMDLRYVDLEKPEMLKGRFEENFPLIYIGDRVIGSSRWSGDGENPQRGRTGRVVKIQHGIQSLFNRDYLIVEMENGGRNFESWLYTLDLAERRPRNIELFKSGKLVYIDDRVKVISRKHPRFGKIGNVRAIFGYRDRSLVYEVRDESIPVLVNEDDKDSKFLVDASSAELIEIFPPNKLFKIE